MTRHVFGMGSFAHKETFSTMIKCEKCLALDEYMDGDKAMQQLTKMVTSMSTELKDVSKAVVKLNSQVFPQGPAPAPAPAAAAPPAKKFLISREVSHREQTPPAVAESKQVEVTHQEQTP